jgi:hypothetical protein
MDVKTVSNDQRNVALKNITASSFETIASTVSLVLTHPIGTSRAYDTTIMSKKEEMLFRKSQRAKN